MTVGKTLPISYNIELQFISQASFLTRLTYSFFSVQAVRLKFYFAWTFGKLLHYKKIILHCNILHYHFLLRYLLAYCIIVNSIYIIQGVISAHLTAIPYAKMDNLTYTTIHNPDF